VGFAVAAPYAFVNSEKQKTQGSPAFCVSSPKHLYKEISPVIWCNTFFFYFAFLGKIFI